MKDSFIPQVTFGIAPLDMEADLFYSFTKKERTRWGSVLDRVYPELLPMISEAKNQTEALSRCKEFATKLHDVHKGAIDTTRTDLQSSWDAVGPEFLQTLAECFETVWPVAHPVIIGYVSVQPVYPRFLDTFSFCVGYRNPQNVEVSAHEILHFLWFKKWSEVFPEMSSATYNSPHLVWRLSEIMDPIILQCHPTIKDLIKPKQWGYRSFESIKIGDVSMTEHFRRVYEDAVKTHANFTDILRTLWDEIQKHEAEVSVF